MLYSVSRILIILVWTLIRLEEYFFKQLLPPSKHTLLQPALLKYFLNHKHTNAILNPSKTNTKLLQTYPFFHLQQIETIETDTASDSLHDVRGWKKVVKNLGIHVINHLFK